jgi:hypothetical protein
MTTSRQEVNTLALKERKAGGRPANGQQHGGVERDCPAD